jgi:hypothetical protein
MNKSVFGTLGKSKFTYQEIGVPGERRSPEYLSSYPVSTQTPSAWKLTALPYCIIAPTPNQTKEKAS